MGSIPTWWCKCAGRIQVSFICFGPTSKFFASILAMGGQSNCTVEGKKEGSRKAQRKLNMERASKEREVGIDRGMMFEFLECNVLS